MFELYFDEHMKDKSIDILSLIQDDFKSLYIDLLDIPKSNFELLDIAEQLISKWSSPDNLVQSRIKLFAIRSPEILKPIIQNSK